MNDAPIRRRSPWKIVGIIAAVAAGILLVAGVWVRSITQARWERLEAELRGLAKKERDRDPHRPVLRGTAVPGNAWDDYRLALAEFSKVPGQGKLGELVRREPKADPAVGTAALAQGGRVLELLAQGAAKDSSRYGFDWEQGFQMKYPRYQDMIAVVSLAVLKARSLEADGKRRDAAAVLIDAAQFGRDAADEGPLIMGLMGLAMLAQALDGVRELSASADPETLADLEAGLAQLDRRFPTYGDCLRREHLGMAWALISGDPEIAAGAGAGWGFVQKLVYLKAYERNSEFLERSAQASARSWSESRSTSAAIQDEVSQSWNPIVKWVVPGLGSTEKTFRERRTQLRLLQAAVHFRRTGELLDVADPFGDKILSVRTGDALKLWSVGMDGLDHGGKGEWKAAPGPDIVLETKR